MADITITIDDAYMDKFNSLIPIICAARGYQTNVPDPTNPGKLLPNPVTPQSFVLGLLYKHLSEIKTSYLGTTEGEKARLKAIADSQAQAIPADKITVTMPTTVNPT